MTRSISVAQQPQRIAIEVKDLRAQSQPTPIAKGTTDGDGSDFDGDGGDLTH